MKRKRHIFRMIAALLLLSPLLVFFFIQTPPGRRMLTERLSTMLSQPGVREVRIEGLSGWIPWDMAVSRIEVADAEGVWLSAEALDVRWALTELFSRRVHVHHLTADRITLQRMPKGGGAVTAEDAPTWPSVEVALDALQVDRLHLGEDVAGIPLTYGVSSGGIRLSADSRLNGSLQVTGDAHGQVAFETFPASVDGPYLVLETELDALNRPTLGLDALAGQARFEFSAAGLTAQAAVSIQKDEQQGEVEARFTWADTELEVEELTFEGAGLTATGEVSAAFHSNRVDMALALDVTDPDGRTYAVQGEPIVRTGAGAWSVEAGKLMLQAGTWPSVQVSGSVTAERIDLKGVVKPFNIQDLPISGASNLTGRIRTACTLSGPLDAPALNGSLEVMALTGRGRTLSDLPALDLHVGIQMVDGLLDASTQVTNASMGFLTASMQMPCIFSLRPINFDPAPEAVKAELDAELDLSILNQIYWLADQRVSGRLLADLSYAEGAPSGTLSIRDGGYEHYRWGIVLLDLFMQLRAVEGGFVVEQGRATDGEDGRMTLSGGLQDGAFDLQAVFDRARMLRRAEATAWLSGKLKLTEQLTHPTLSGELTVDRCEILVDQLIGSRPPVLEDFDAYAKTNQTRRAQASSAPPFDVDVRVDFSDQIHINASLIDSIWGGQVRFNSLPKGVAIDGRIEPVRGYVNFIGKKFRLVDGAVLVDGTLPPEAVFDTLTAEYTRGDVTAQLVLNGRLSNPQYQLTSTPAMPQDEILSYVLFNRELSTISPYQAVQIASAARQLSGGLQGPGFMYQFRQAIGIDTLEWREEGAEGEGSSVAAGKYLTSSLYFEVNTSFGEEPGTGMAAEYEVTRHFSIETSTGPQMRPGVGINWKYDY